MCSWCWGHRPVWDVLSAEIGKRVPVEYRVGGLAPDSDAPMPEEQQAVISATWRRIHDLLGTEFNFDFWTTAKPRRSTYPACRASIAARWQDAELAMVDALQRAYYLRAMNPSDTAVHVQLAGELGLDIDRFTADLGSDSLQDEFTAELEFSRSLPIQGFPSLVLVHKGMAHSIELDYKDHRAALKQVDTILAA
ncbi:dsba oxidoreductase [Luminiphilus syltensis NOR5-1B]|uniref:Dsba oxidoreductase n=2 Tax=Luminiphilus TaxID=1341118 RepID=B8KYN2_9GAMM|nr:dsba oxidoreductase [Luminiphilus syltensis NOR5-1B]